MQPTVAHAFVTDLGTEDAPRGLNRLLGAGLFMLLLAAVLVATLMLRTAPL